MRSAMKALTPAEGEGYELPVIQNVDAYGSEGGTALKFSVISSDRQIASVHARLNIDQAVALMKGTRLALRGDAGDEESAEARVVTHVRAVRREKAIDCAPTDYLHVVTETENGPLVLRISSADAAELAALIDRHARANG